MDFKDNIKQLGDRVQKLKDQVLTEEATKNAFIMPFLQALGYDVFNPLEIVPEYTCDIGIKKGEKIDYAILKEGQPTILVECKHWGQNLELHDGQLLRYFNISKAKFGILTNGIIYRFYTDLVEPNKMDEKPFFEFDITAPKENQVEELKKFHKSYFDIDNIVNSASDLKYTNEIKNIFANEFKEPSEALVKLIVSQVYNGRATEKVMSQFTELVKRSIQQLISDIITDRFKSALSKEEDTQKKNSDLKEPAISEDNTDPKDNKIITTQEELESYFIVKAMVRKTVDSERIYYRDTQTYFGILLDDNNRKPICRIYLNGGKKFLSTFDENKKETKHEIFSLDDIYKYSDELINAIFYYEKSVKKESLVSLQ